MHNIFQDIKNILENNEIIILNTDTIYGFVANPYSKVAIDRVYKIKNRNRNKPLALIASSFAMLEKFIIVEPILQEILRNIDFSLTVIGKKKNDSLAQEINLNDNSLAIRITKNEELKKLIDFLEYPLLATSVNVAGESALLEDGAIKNKFSHIPIFNLGIKSNNQESPIVTIENGAIKILRATIEQKNKIEQFTRI